MAEVKLEAFLDIEASLAEALGDAWERESRAVVRRVTKAVDEQRFDDAQEIIRDELTWDGVFEETGRLTELMLTEAMLFGASRQVATENIDLSVFPPEVVQSMRTQLFNALGLDTLSTLKRELSDMIQLERRRLLEKSDYVFKSDLFTSAAGAVTETMGRDSALINASLANSRMASYGFLKHAIVVTGDVQYEISEQLDRRICPVCEEMHGKQFRAEQTIERLEEAVLTENPDDLKTLMPWPGQSKAAVEELRTLSDEELASRGFATPPFHPLCRGVLITAGTGGTPVSQRVETVAEPEDTSAPFLSERDFKQNQQLDDKMVEFSREEYIGNLTQGMAQAAFRYQNSEAEFNVPLRKGTTSGAPVEVLDRAIKQSKLPQDMMIHRGIDGKGLKAVMDEAGVGSPDEMVGGIFSDKGFASTSLDKEVAGRFTRGVEGAVLNIKARKGQRGLYVNGVDRNTEFATEFEMLLPRNSEFRVVGAGRDDKGRVVFDVELL